MGERLIAGDCLVELPKLASAGERFHCCVTDPPYHLTSIVKRFGATSQADNTQTSERARGRTDAYARASAGFMGKKWDGGDVAFRPELWRAVYDVLLPGAFLLAFGGTRTYHRMVCAVEDAGFEIRDTVAWLYGSGFPKSLDVSKAIDKAAGAQREVIDRVRIKSGGTEHINRSNAAVHDYRPDGYQKGENVLDITAPATAEAAAWQGWGTALKPAMELICVARKPLEGTVAANVLKHGCGGLNIDASRVATEDRLQASASEGVPFGCHYEKGTGVKLQPAGLGRWPANVVHDGSEEVLAAFALAGESSSGTGAIKKATAAGHQANAYGKESRPAGTPMICHGDSGSAARFFYSSKADKADRADSKHPTVKPVDLMRWLVTLVCPPSGRVLDPFAGSGTTGEACMLAGFDCTLIERDPQHVKDIEHRIKRWSGLDQPLFAEPAA